MAPDSTQVNRSQHFLPYGFTHMIFCSLGWCWLLSAVCCCSRDDGVPSRRVGLYSLTRAHSQGSHNIAPSPSPPPPLSGREYTTMFFPSKGNVLVPMRPGALSTKYLFTAVGVKRRCSRPLEALSTKYLFTLNGVNGRGSRGASGRCVGGEGT